MKRNKILIVTMILMLATVMNLFAGMMPVGAVPTYASGSGTASDPYIISTKEQLQSLQGQSLDGKYITLGDNIDLDGETWDPIVAFKNATFDGNYCTISNFKVTQMATGQRYTGLFGTVTGSAIVKDLTISNGEVIIPTISYSTSDQDADIGMLCGQLGGTSKVSNCTLTDCAISVADNATVAARRVRIGGIAGYSGGVTIEYCDVDVDITVSGISYGANDHGASVGGIVGQTGNTAIKYCISKGGLTLNEITGSDSNLGGIVGHINGASNISYNVSSGTLTQKNAFVSGSRRHFAGGIIGYFGNQSSATMKYNYSIACFGAECAANSIGTVIGRRGASGVPNATNAVGNIAVVNDRPVNAQASGENDYAVSAMTEKSLDEINSDNTYNYIIAEIAEHLTGISTDYYGYQTTAINANNKFDLRLIATVSGDIAKCESLGFEVKVKYTANGAEQATTLTPDDFIITKVYDSVTTTDGQGNENMENTHSAGSMGGDYIFVLACKNMPTDVVDGKFTFTVRTFYKATSATQNVYSGTEIITVTAPADTLIAA